MTTPPEHDTPFPVTDSIGDVHTVHSDDQVDAQVPSAPPVTSGFADTTFPGSHIYVPAPSFQDVDPTVTALHLIIQRLDHIDTFLASIDSYNQLTDRRLNWIHESVSGLNNMLAGIQHAAMSMGGPMGAMVRKMTGGK